LDIKDYLDVDAGIRAMVFGAPEKIPSFNRAGAADKSLDQSASPLIPGNNP